MCVCTLIHLCLCTHEKVRGEPLFLREGHFVVCARLAGLWTSKNFCLCCTTLQEITGIIDRHYPTHHCRSSDNVNPDLRLVWQVSYAQKYHNNPHTKFKIYCMKGKNNVPVCVLSSMFNISLKVKVRAIRIGKVNTSYSSWRGYTSSYLLHSLYKSIWKQWNK